MTEWAMHLRMVGRTGGAVAIASRMQSVRILFEEAGHSIRLAVPDRSQGKPISDWLNGRRWRTRQTSDPLVESVLARPAAGSSGWGGNDGRANVQAAPFR